MSKTRPQSVDPIAWWSPGDNEWVLGPKDKEDKFHGRVTYWRPDGTLVNHCDFNHGAPHGEYKRYHQSGEISRQGTFVQGKLQGTDVFLRSDSPTTENFPAGLSEKIWRAEMDMVNGEIVAGRLFNKEGIQIGEDGTPVPLRPAGIPKEATYSSTSGRWVCGKTSDYQRDGLWLFFTQEGWIQEEITYLKGKVQNNTFYQNKFESNAAGYLRAKEYTALEKIIDEGVTVAEDEIDKLVLIQIKVQSLSQQGKDNEAVIIAEEAVRAYLPQAHWGRFTIFGQRGYNSIAELECFLAENYINQGRNSDALTYINQAIGHATSKKVKYYVTKAHALKLLGRTDEMFAAIKHALSIDQTSPQLKEYAEQPRFIEWLKEIDPESMTEKGAWEILGEAGEKLEQYHGVLVGEKDSQNSGETEETQIFNPEEMDYCLDSPWDFSSLPDTNPELNRFAELFGKLDIHNYNGELEKACESTLTAAVRQIDGNWLARMQGIFLPGSLVKINDEDMCIASWHPTRHQTSRIYSIHQDEKKFYHCAETLSAMIASNLKLDDEEVEHRLSQRKQNRLARAVELTSENAAETLPPHLDLLRLEPRTHWIVNILVGNYPESINQIRLGKDIATAATLEDWEHEKKYLNWPHLQAYWLFHHAVFGNNEFLADILTQANHLYPGVAELAKFAAQLLEGTEHKNDFWEKDRINEYRLRALEERPELLSKSAKAKILTENKKIFEANRTMEEAFAELKKDPEDEKLVRFLENLNRIGSNTGAFQESMCEQTNKTIDYIIEVKKGRVTPFETIFENMKKLRERMQARPEIEAPLRKLLQAALTRGSDLPDEHKSVMLGDLMGLGILTIDSASDFETFFEQVKSMGFYPEKFGRFRRLQVAMLATPYIHQSEVAMNFLKQEAARYAKQMDEWKTDTFNFADRILTEIGDEEQIKSLNARLCKNHFSGANWDESLRIVQHFLKSPSPLMVEGLKTAVEQELGRHDDANRATVVRAYAKCIGTKGRRTILHWLENTQDVRVECEKAALIAGLIEIDVGTDEIQVTLREAQKVLQQLIDDDMQLGAAISLLQTIHDHKITGFAAHAKSVNETAQKSNYLENNLKKWCQEHVNDFSLF